MLFLCVALICKSKPQDFYTLKVTILSMSWFGLVDDSIDLDSFFNQYAAFLEALNNSFSHKGFPEATVAEVNALLALKGTFKNVIVHGQNMRVECQDFLIDMESALRNFQNGLRVGDLAIAAQRRDFVSAKKALFNNSFKKIKDDFSDSSIANLKSFQRILWLLGA